MLFVNISTLSLRSRQARLEDYKRLRLRLSMPYQFVANDCALSYHANMSELKRVTFLLPENYYEMLVQLSEQKAEAMSSIARRLIIDYLEANPPKPGPKREG